MLKNPTAILTGWAAFSLAVFFTFLISDPAGQGGPNTSQEIRNLLEALPILALVSTIVSGAGAGLLMWVKCARDN